MNYLKLTSLLGLAVLTSCSAKLASIKVPDDLSAQPVHELTTAGDFWGLGMDGTFDLAGLYKGKYDRSASGSSYFGDLISTQEGSMAAEVTNISNQKTWILNCYGGGTSINIGNFSFGGDSPYQCKITDKNKRHQGTFTLKKSADLIDFGPSGKVEGSLMISGKKYDIESIHNMEGSFIPVDHPVGYYFKKNGNVVAAVQVNGRITLQSDEKDMDNYAIATIASALSVRPED